MNDSSFGSMIDINTPSPFSLHSLPDGALFKIIYKYKNHSSYHSFQSNDDLIIKNIFAFVCKSRQRGIYMGNLEYGIRNPEEVTAGQATEYMGTASNENVTAFVNRCYFSDSYQGCVFIPFSRA